MHAMQPKEPTIKKHRSSRWVRELSQTPFAMITRSKTKKMEKNYESLPQDIQIEIFLRMPVKSLGKCICVSKNWAAIIREKTFRDRYLLQSMTRPRLLFVLTQGEEVTNVLFRIRRNPFIFSQREDDLNVLFHSVYQEKEPLLSSGQQQMRHTLEPYSEVCAVTRGLVCIKSETKVVLCNPATSKFLSLPELRERYRGHEVCFDKTFLGYDEATDVFKVLSLTKKEVDNTFYTGYRVFTVGSGEECWRKIGYKSGHTPVTEGLCKDGVLYYGAWSRSVDPFVISFNLGSEELNVIELPTPIAINLLTTSLVNYNGEIAWVKCLVDESGEIKIWVRNETAGDWREEGIVIPRWRETVGDLCDKFCFKGTIGTGELIFALDGYIEGSMVVLYYDRITQHLRKFEIKGLADGCYASTYLGYVDSLLLM